eukprot:jgi/Mesvir1/5663/Mv15681-RA.1
MKPHPLPAKWPDAETARVSDTQTYIQNYFEGRIWGEKPPDHRAVGKNSCSHKPADMKQAPQQAVINMYLRGVAQRGSRHRGFLAWHSTGSGKTCTVLGALDAFWDTNKDIFLATSRENAVNNTIAGYGNCASMFPRFQGMTKEQAVRMIAKRVVENRIMTFSQLTHLLDLYRGLKDKKRANKNLLRNSVLIMDEVQNLFSPPSGQAREYTTLMEFLEKPNPHTQGLYMVILSATPGRNEEEIHRLLTMIRGKPVFPDSPLDAFKGLCSFVDYAGDESVYPTREPDKLHWIPMSEDQATAVRKRVKEVRESVTNRERYLYEPRRYSNSLSMLRMAPSYVKKHLDTISPKIACIVSEIEKHANEKQYLYSAFNAHGIKYVANVLDAEGYAPLSLRGEFPASAAKRYALLGSDSMPVTDEALRRVLSVFNDERNANGEYLHVILARKRFNEGLDLKSVRHIHIMEPLLDVNSERQAIARAVRHCSHLQLDKKKWTVTVHRYLTIDGVDQRVMERAMKEHASEGVTKYMEKLREAAIDCRLMSKVHNRPAWMKAGLRELPIACPLTRGEQVSKYVREKGLKLLKVSMEFAKTAFVSAGHALKENLDIHSDDLKAIAQMMKSAMTRGKKSEATVEDIKEVQKAVQKVETVRGFGDRPIRQLVMEGYWLG